MTRRFSRGDEPGLVDKLSNIDELSVLDGARSVTGLVPGAKGTIVGGAVEAVHGEVSSRRERDELRRAGIHLSQTKTRAGRRKKDELEHRSTWNVVKFGVSALGSVAGGFLASMVLGPVAAAIPFGSWIVGGVGALGGGYLTSVIYDNVAEPKNQDGVTIAAQNYSKIREGGEAITRQEAFAQLMAVMPPKAQSRYEDLLERYAGTRDFAEALQTKKGQRALARMMKDRNLEDLLRGYAGIPVDPANPNQHVADQYAELVNNGSLDPRAIVMDHDRVRAAASRYYRDRAVHDGYAPAYEDDPVALQRQLPAGGARVRQQEV